MPILLHCLRRRCAGWKTRLRRLYARAVGTRGGITLVLCTRRDMSLFVNYDDTPPQAYSWNTKHRAEASRNHYRILPPVQKAPRAMLLST